jgi:hypothetical protein
LILLRYIAVSKRLTRKDFQASNCASTGFPISVASRRCHGRVNHQTVSSDPVREDTDEPDILTQRVTSNDTAIPLQVVLRSSTTLSLEECI